MDILPIPGFHEPFSALSHLIGAVVFGVRFFWLLKRSRGHPHLTAYLAIYAFSCVLLLSMSGVYHMLPEGTGRTVLRRLDLAAIFILIAGTHTPIQGLFFRGFWRWGVLTLMWLIVALGVTLFSIFADDLPRGLGTGTFLLLGWIGGSSGLVVWRRHGFAFVRPLVLGGLAYSVGAILVGVGWPWLIPGFIGPHEMWHIAVLIAVSLHWRFMYQIGSPVRQSSRADPRPASTEVEGTELGN